MPSSGGGEGAGSINLYDSHNRHVAILIMRSGPGDLPAAQQGDDGLFRVYMQRSAWPDVIDTLRNEKPVYFHFWHGAQNNSHIGTTPEPVGENEIQPRREVARFHP